MHLTSQWFKNKALKIITQFQEIPDVEEAVPVCVCVPPRWIPVVWEFGGAAAASISSREYQPNQPSGAPRSCKFVNSEIMSGTVIR